MNHYEKRPRFIVLVQSVCIAIGTVWFTISVAAVFVALVVPFTWKNAIIERNRKDVRIIRHHRVPNHPSPNQEASPLCKGGSYCISLDASEDLPVSPKATTPVVGSDPLVSPSLPAHSDRRPAPRRQPTTASVPEAREDEAVSTPPPRSASASPVPSEEQRSTKSNKSGMLARLPHLLHLKSKKASDDGHCSGSGRSSKSRSPSPIRKLFPKSQPEEPADAHGRIPYVRNPENVERLTTTFVNPFKITTKRSRNGSTTSTPERPSTSLPPSPEIISPRRNPDDGPLQSIAMRVKHAVRPRISSATFRPSPPRRAFSASSSSSAYSTSSSNSSRRSSTSSTERDARRTQPYGPPYYASPPTARPKPRRSSGTRMSVDVRQPINEEVEPEELGQSTAVEGENALGLTLRHHHEMQ